MVRLLMVAMVLMTSAALSIGAASELELPPVTYPELARNGAHADAFIPPGWALEASATGDLNGDGSSDLVMVLQDQDPKKIIDNKGLGVRSLNSNPRILAVALFDRAKGSFELALQNHTLIPRYESPTLDDAFDKTDGISVRRGAFTVTLGLFANAGGWDMGRTTFTFRHEQQSFRLIGYDRHIVTRNSGRTRTISVNYATGRIRTATGTISDDAERVAWTTRKTTARVTIAEVGNGMDFEPVVDGKE